MSISVIDQWKNRRPVDLVRKREIISRGKSKAEGSAYSDADNADQFYVLLRP